MTKTTILYIGNCPEISATIYRLLNAGKEWQGEICSAVEAIDFCAKKNAFDIVLMGCGIGEKEEDDLRSFFTQKYPNSKLIQHYGGGGGLLTNEILAAMTTRPANS